MAKYNERDARIVIDPLTDLNARVKLPSRLKVGDTKLYLAELLDMGDGKDEDGKPVMLLQMITGGEGLFSPLTPFSAQQVIKALQGFIDENPPKETIN